MFSERQTQCSWNKDFFPQPHPHEKREIKADQSLIKSPKKNYYLLLSKSNTCHLMVDLVNTASIFQKYDQKEFTLRRRRAQNVDHIPLKLRKTTWLLKTYSWDIRKPRRCISESLFSFNRQNMVKDNTYNILLVRLNWNYSNPMLVS